jgi:hypothetical protein
LFVLQQQSTTRQTIASPIFLPLGIVGKEVQVQASTLGCGIGIENSFFF